jgi:hypothetical protein
MPAFRSDWHIVMELKFVLKLDLTTVSQTYWVRFYVLLTVHLGSVHVNNQLNAQFFLKYIYSNSLHVSSTPVFIIRRINCINHLNAELNPICHLLSLLGAHLIFHVSRIRVNTTSGICNLCRWPSSVQVWRLDGHLHRVTYTRYRIRTIDSPDDEYRGARNM